MKAGGNRCVRQTSANWGGIINHK
uniref:Uncharacterized protein n=1 Tax=Anguilla anguilla TaxID=7936 RepID=A0A0E9SYV3_ANGAN